MRVDKRPCPPFPLPSGQEFRCSDGHRISYYEYPPHPQKTATGINLVVLHGIQSHAGWYSGSCREFSNLGHRVLALTRRGSGIDQVHRGDTPGWRRLVLDIQEFLLDQQLKRPGGTWVLMGISWGGKLAAALASRCPDLIEGLALVCPGIEPKVGLGFFTRLKILFSRLLRPSSLFPIPLDDPGFFTGKPDWQEYIRQDPFSLRKATARFLVESVRLDLWLRMQSRGWKVPTFLLLAGQERIVDSALTRTRIEGWAEGPIAVREYPEANHTLEFEGPEIPWVEDTQVWLEQIAAPVS